MWKIRKIISKGDYFYALVPEHPFATKNGYVLEHRIVMENHLGRLLNPDEIVHHENGQKKDNRIINLVILSKLEHARLHALERGRKYVDLKCPECAVLFSRTQNVTHLAPSRNAKATFCSGKCRGRFSRRKQLIGETPEMKLAVSENIVREYRKYSLDNPEQTLNGGCVETKRQPPEKR